ncbi:hypothetical protein [Halopiger thermotolerans]
MGDTIRVSAGDLAADEIIAAIEAGDRVVVATTVAGGTHEIVLRYDGSVYYCDTPTRLHRHESEGEMRTCIRRMGYGADADADAAGPEADAESPTDSDAADR